MVDSDDELEQADDDAVSLTGSVLTKEHGQDQHDAEKPDTKNPRPHTQPSQGRRT